MSEGAEEHTLESPKLSNEAAKAFFVGSAAKVDSLRREWKEYYTSMDQSLLATYRGNQRTTWDMAEGYRTTFCESSVSKNSKLCEEALAMTKFLNPSFQPSPSYEDKLPARELASLEGFEKKPSKKFSADDLQQLYLMYETYKKYFSPVAFLPISLAPGKSGHLHGSDTESGILVWRMPPAKDSDAGIAGGSGFGVVQLP